MTRRWAARRLSIVVLSSTALLCASCQSRRTPDGDLLPGRSRPLVAHGWPHPRDYRFEPTTFQPPDANAALHTTVSGVRAFIIPDTQDAVVRISAALPLARLHERSGEAGASELITRLLTRRNSSDPAGTLSSGLESLGASLSVQESPDLTRISVEVLPEDWIAGLRLIVGLIRRADFPEAAVAAHRTGNGYASITAGVGGSGFRPKVELERMLVGYPLAPPAPGSTVTMAAVQALAARSLDPSAIVLGIGGPLEKADVQSSLDDLTRDWKSQAIRAERSTWTPAARSSSRLTTIDAPGVVGWIAVARAVSPVPEPDRPALAVAAEILNTRLNIATREIRGLSNRTSFEIPETADNSGLLLIRSAGRVEATAPLLKLSIDEVVRLRKPDDPIPDEELERAKGTLVLGRWQSALDGAREASATYAAETVRRGSVAPLLQWPDAVRAVSVPQVKDAVAKYLQLRDMAAVVVGPIEAIRQARHPRWPATLEESDAALQAAQ